MDIFPMPGTDNLLYYIMVFGFASLCVVIFSSKPVSKGYDFVVDTTYDIFMWIVTRVALPPFRVVEQGLVSAGLGLCSWIEKQKK